MQTSRIIRGYTLKGIGLYRTESLAEFEEMSDARCLRNIAENRVRNLPNPNRKHEVKQMSFTLDEWPETLLNMQDNSNFRN